MTTLAMMATYEKKRLKCYGTVAAGEHVAVTVTDGAQWIGEGRALRLRVLFGPDTVAVFPFADSDTWTAAGTQDADAACELNLNTLQAEKYLKHGGTCLWILDDVENHTLYATGEFDVLPWPKRRGIDEPIDLDGYPLLLDEINGLREEFEAYQQTVSQMLATKQDTIFDLAAIRSGAAAGATAVQLAQIARFVDDAEYKEQYGEQNKPAILFKHGTNVIVALDATPLVKDGMVANVEIVGGNLVITFNTDSGKQPITIPLTDIFNPDNYYDKTAADGKFVAKEAGKGLSTEDYTTAEKTKLGGIAAGAQVNVIETVKVNGTALTPQAKAVNIPVPTLDDAVTPTSANGVKSFGIWSMIWGTLAALPTGFSSLYDWCVAQLAGKLSLTGGTMTGDVSFLSGAKIQDQAPGLSIIGPGVAPNAEFWEFFTGSLDTVVRARELTGKQNALSAPQLANIAAVSDALAFDATHSYAAGDPVVYNGTLYTFTMAHTGAWTGSDVSTVDIIARLADKLDKSGDTMTGSLHMGDNYLKWRNGNLIYWLSTNGLYIWTDGDDVTHSPNYIIEFPLASGTLALTAANPTAGNLAALDASGNPTDSGVKASDKLDASSASAPFSSDSSVSYPVGSHCTYQGKLYKCTTATTGGTWVAASWEADVIDDPDAVLDITAQNQLRVVAKDGTLLWAQGYDLASTSSATLVCDACNNFTFADGATTQAFTLPTAPTGKVGDFGLDIDNSANTGAATMTLTGLDTAFSVVVPEGESLNDMLSIAAGELARFYITLSTFRVNNLPTWHILKQVVENGGAQS